MPSCKSSYLCFTVRNANTFKRYADFSASDAHVVAVIPLPVTIQPAEPQLATTALHTIAHIGLRAGIISHQWRVFHHW